MAEQCSCQCHSSFAQPWHYRDIFPGNTYRNNLHSPTEVYLWSALWFTGKSENHSISLTVPYPHLPPLPQLSRSQRWEDNEMLPSTVGFWYNLHYLTANNEFDGTPVEVCPCSKIPSSFGRWTGSTLGVPGPEKPGIHHVQGHGGRWLSSLQRSWQVLSLREALAWAGEIDGGQDQG